MVVCMYCLIAIILCSLVCLAPAQTQRSSGVHHRILPEWKTHAEKRFIKEIEGSRVSRRRMEGLRHRRQDSQSEPSTVATDNEDQSKAIPTENSIIQGAIERIFKFTNSNQKFNEPPFQIGRSALRPPTLGKSSMEAPECAGGRNFCDGLDEDYPTDIIDNLISENFSKWARFNTDDILTREEQELIDRGDDDPDEIRLCRSRVSKLDITQVQGEDKSWLFVVQSPMLKQSVRVEVCENPDSPCDRLVTDGLASSYRSTCKQKHIVREMLLLNRTSPPSLYAGPVYLASCCACVLSRRPLDQQDDDDDASPTATDDQSYRSTDDHRPSDGNKGCSQKIEGSENVHETVQMGVHRTGASNTTASSTADSYNNRWLSIGFATSLMFVLYVCV